MRLNDECYVLHAKSRYRLPCMAKSNVLSSRKVGFETQTSQLARVAVPYCLLFTVRDRDLAYNTLRSARFEQLLIHW